MSAKSHTKRQITWQAARKACYDYKGAIYQNSFKTVDDERFEKFYKKHRDNYIKFESILKEMEEVYGK